LFSPTESSAQWATSQVRTLMQMSQDDLAWGLSREQAATG